MGLHSYNKYILCALLLMLTGCASFERHSNDRLEVPDLQDNKQYLLLIYEQQVDQSLSNRDVDRLIRKLENTDSILNVHYNESNLGESDYNYENLIPILLSIEYTYDGSKDARTVACYEVMWATIGMIPIPCKWRTNHSVLASGFNDSYDSMEEYFEVNRRVDTTAWLNWFGVVLYPIAMLQDDIVDSLYKDIIIALDAYDR